MTCNGWDSRRRITAHFVAVAESLTSLKFVGVLLNDGSSSHELNPTDSAIFQMNTRLRSQCTIITVVHKESLSHSFPPSDIMTRIYDIITGADLMWQLCGAWH